MGTIFRVKTLVLGNIRRSTEEFALILELLQGAHMMTQAGSNEDGPDTALWVGEKFFSPQQSPLASVRDDPSLKGLAVAFVAVDDADDPVAHLFLTYDDRGVIAENEAALMAQCGENAVPFCLACGKVQPHFLTGDVDGNEKLMAEVREAADFYIQDIKAKTTRPLVQVLFDPQDEIERVHMPRGFSFLVVGGNKVEKEFQGHQEMVAVRVV